MTLSQSSNEVSSDMHACIPSFSYGNMRSMVEGTQTSAGEKLVTLTGAEGTPIRPLLDCVTDVGC
jgi:hypothetical protein